MIKRTRITIIRIKIKVRFPDDGEGIFPAA
jgi:hypothetical protein